MKARLLKSILNNTRYTVSNHSKYIAVGSPLCHDLIKVKKDTLELTYALDAFHTGRSSIKSEELEFIWDKLAEMIADGSIQDIINGEDLIENPLPVFFVENGILIEEVTDAYGWPNCSNTGRTLYDNSSFKTKEDALNSGIADAGYAIEQYNRMKKEAEEEVDKRVASITEWTTKKLDLEMQLFKLQNPTTT